MITLIVREFTVHRPLPQAWDHLSRIEEWPSWAKHIRKIDLQPPGELGIKSTGVIHLVGGMTSAFRMTEYNPPRSWKWAGPILWLTVGYDHRFEPIDANHTRLTWIVEAQGLGASTIGRLFAMFYRRSMERAIARLIEEMHTQPTLRNSRFPTPDS